VGSDQPFGHTDIEAVIDSGKFGLNRKRVVGLYQSKRGVGRVGREIG